MEKIIPPPHTKQKQIGFCPVDSGQILLVDPCYLKDWIDNEYDSKHKKQDFSYAGACAATTNKECGGQLKKGKIPLAVAVESGWGDGLYPVYVEYVQISEKDFRPARVIIDFGI